MKNDFYKAETRCDYYVSEEIKRLWGIQMNSLKLVMEICERHGLKYYAIGGTLLGAVRHQGYIPWDDDIDVGMLKEDYDKFCKYAAEEIKAPYFFQDFRTQHGFAPKFSRVRRSDTTACTQYESKIADENYNMGIFVDIFPITNVADGKLSLFCQKFSSGFWLRVIAGFEQERFLRMKNQFSAKSYLKYCILLWKMFKPFYTYEQLSEKYLNACSCKKSSTVGLVPFLRFQKKYTWKREWFDEQVLLPFEDMQICCPKEWDKVLKQQYGDYNVFVKGTALHSFYVVDTERPYTEVMKELFEKRKTELDS